MDEMVPNLDDEIPRVSDVGVAGPKAILSMHKESARQSRAD